MPRSQYRSDAQSFAQTFLDLWQEQIARAMTDTDFLHTLMDQMQTMQRQGAAAWHTGGGRSHEQAQHAPQTGGRKPADPYSAPASGAGDDELADLRARLAACERRLQRVEARQRAAQQQPPGSRKEAKPAAKAKSKAAPKRNNTKARATKQPAKPAKPVRKLAIKRT